MVFRQYKAPTCSRTLVKPSGPNTACSPRTTAAGSGGWAFTGCLAARKKRQRQNRLPDLIFYDHHQSRIVVVRIVAALFLQLLDFVFGMRKCRHHIRQLCEAFGKRESAIFSSTRVSIPSYELDTILPSYSTTSSRG